MGDGHKTRLKAVLVQKGVSQKTLAREADVKEYKISLLCNNRDENIFLSTAQRICEVLDCTLDEAFGDRTFDGSEEDE